MAKKVIKLGLLFFFLSGALSSPCQDFNSLISQTADTLSKKIVATGKIKIAITDFINIDESTTQLGVLLSEEISSELANLTENQSKFRVLERANLNQIFKEKHLVNFTDPTGLAKELGKIDAADALLFATITDFDGYYRVVIKMLDTRNGDALSSYKVSFVKTPSLENLNKVVVKKPKHLLSESEQNSSIENVEPAKGDKTLGDYCFKNIVTSRKGKADVKVINFASKEEVKIISVGVGETSCAFGLNPGVYTLKIYWTIDGWNGPLELKEIRVVAGKSGTLELKL